MSEHMSLEEYRKLTGQAKPVSKSKYHNEPCYVDGIRFDSKAEGRRYQTLKMLQQAGEIKGFGRQPSFVIGLGVRYVPDFIVCDSSGKIWVEDVKSAGTETAVFKVKQNLWNEKYPWIELRIVRDT